MSTGTKPQVLLPAYDAHDLRRRMLVCFTIGELYAFATKLQVPQTPGWSNNPQEAARDIVRHFERSGALAFLVEALRETKPVVEWPEPLPLPVPPAPAPVAAPAPAPHVAPTLLGAADPAPAASALPVRGAPATGPGGGSTLLGVPAPQALEFADTALEAPGDRPTPIADVSAAVLEAATHRSTPPAGPPAPPGFAPSVMPKPGDAPAPGASAAVAFSPVPAGSPAHAPPADTMPASLRVSPAAASPPSVRRPAAAAWPGTAPEMSPRKGPDPRVLMAVGTGILLALIGVAFLAGRASSAQIASGSGTTSGAPAPPGDHVVLSQNVADALGTSLLRVAKACQIDPSSLRGRSLFEVAYRRCGPPPAPTVQSRAGGYDPAPPTPGDPGQTADPDPPAGGKKGSRTSGAAKPAQRPDPVAGQPSTGGSSCLAGCSRSHGACTSKCGAEPQQGSQYDAYQSCLGGCLKALSQCKMGCQ